jgi:hypothetical protein
MYDLFKAKVQRIIFRLLFQSLFFLLNAVYLAENPENANCIVFDLTRLGLEPMIYSSRDEHDNRYTTDVV